MSHYCHDSAVIVQLFFCNSWTSHSRFNNWLFAPRSELTSDLYKQPQPSKFSQLTQWLLLRGIVLASLESGRYKYCWLSDCRLSDLVLNLLLCMGKNITTSCSFLFMQLAFFGWCHQRKELRLIETWVRCLGWLFPNQFSWLWNHNSDFSRLGSSQTAKEPRLRFKYFYLCRSSRKAKGFH